MLIGKKSRFWKIGFFWGDFWAIFGGSAVEERKFFFNN